ncbi:hypothetical protein GGS26DRAFT_599225 [Hypomontagnella submonticulosa]|nr:hypothetical protein GGS26DRAFT_599225 [Hypomontagnella submonticulosa]
MKFSNFLGLAALASTASAGCFSGGEKWDGDKNAVLGTIDQVCTNGTLNRKYPAGSWDDNRPISHSWGLKSNRIVTLTIWLNNIWGDTPLSMESCKDGLKKEVNGCEHGGVSEYTTWKYRADINTKK